MMKRCIRTWKIEAAKKALEVRDVFLSVISYCNDPHKSEASLEEGEQDVGDAQGMADIRFKVRKPGWVSIISEVLQR